MPNFKKQEPRFVLREEQLKPAELVTLNLLFDRNAFSENNTVCLQAIHDKAVSSGVTKPRNNKSFNASLTKMYSSGLVARVKRGKEFAYYLPGVSEYKEALDHHGEESE